MVLQEPACTILVVNPNTTASMTAKIGEAARSAASPGTKIMAVNPAIGPAAIEGHFDGAMSVPGMLAEIRIGEDSGVDAHIIACFDDTGLDAARALASAPVIGIGEAAFHLASLVAHRFSVVTTLSRSISTIEANLFRYGLASRCAGVHAADVPVLALEEPGSHARGEVSQAVARAIAHDGAEAVVLGCAGMADLAALLSAEQGVPVVDGVAAAVTLAEGLVRMRLRTSKTRSYAPPLRERHGSFFGPKMVERTGE